LSRQKRFLRWCEISEWKLKVGETIFRLDELRIKEEGLEKFLPLLVSDEVFINKEFFQYLLHQRKPWSKELFLALDRATSPNLSLFRIDDFSVRIKRKGSWFKIREVKTPIYLTKKFGD